ncbi:MAG: DUF3102 domain-containing protein [Cyanobacteria bacterium J06643_4]
MARSTKPAPINALFDYDSLEVSQRELVQQRTGEIRERLRRSAQDVWEIGQKLSDVRSRLQYGQFLAWIKAEFGWSQRTAYNFMNVYETFGDRFANLARVNIATSLLYQLASPSVPEELRDQVLRAAQQGETLTAKELRATIKKRKQLKSAAQPADTQKGKPSPHPKITGLSPEETPAVNSLDIVTVIPQSAEVIEDKTSNRAKKALAPKATAPVDLIPIEVGNWYQLAGQHLVFCGDTASQPFVSWAPTAELAIALTGHDWAHDWLIDQADNVVVLPKSECDADKLKQLLQLLSKPGDVVIFPWLPHAEMLAIAHTLGRSVYAGEANADNCRQAIAASGLGATALAPSYVAELVG